VIRLCVDLNVWCANFLAERAGRVGTASQTIIGAVRRGQCALGPVQLIISWGMLNRLRAVLEREWQVPADIASSLTSAIAAFAAHGPIGESPYITLGGTGIMPIRDEEDGHVMDTALAGRADYVTTANLADFSFPGTRTVTPDRLLEYQAPHGVVRIVHPYEFVRILTQ
jgi:hypothetical protein